MARGWPEITIAVRGDRPELCIKDLKEGCFADRLSCHRFWANQFWLLVHAAAYYGVSANSVTESGEVSQ